MLRYRGDSEGERVMNKNKNNNENERGHSGLETITTIS
jgi:hypothetical protein